MPPGSKTGNHRGNFHKRRTSRSSKPRGLLIGACELRFRRPQQPRRLRDRERWGATPGRLDRASRYRCDTLRSSPHALGLVRFWFLEGLGVFGALVTAARICILKRFQFRCFLQVDKGVRIAFRQCKTTGNSPVFRSAPSRKPYFSRNESSMRKMLSKGHFKVLETFYFT